MASIFDTEDIKEDYFWKEYYLILQMYFLSKKIADDKGLFLSGGTDSHEKQIFSREPKITSEILEKIYN